MAEGIEPTLENLHRFTLTQKGKPRRRANIGQGGFWKLAREIEREFEAAFGRPMTLADLVPATAETMLNTWKRAGERARTLVRRRDRFDQRNATAAALGWLERHDFSGLHVGRKTDWTQNRKTVPPPAPDRLKRRGRPTMQRMTLSDLLGEHYIPARLVGKSDNSIRLYRVTIRNFGRWLGRPPIVGDLNTQTVAGYLRWLIDNTELSPHTIEKERAELVAFWNFSAKRGWLPTFPDVPSVNCPKRVPDAWSDAEMVALMQAAESTPGRIGRVDASTFWPALIATIYDCGERISAVLRVTHDDIDAHGWLTVRGEYRKGKTRDRRYKLRPATMERIRSMGGSGTDRVFDWCYSDGLLFARFGEILSRAGLPNTRRSKFHKIRRTVASNFEAAGGNATELLDHTDRRTTQAYLDPRVLREKQPADVLPAIGETIEAAAKQGEVSADVLD